MSRKTFELNGKAYDALTGALLGDAPRASNAIAANSNPATTVAPGAQPIAEPALRHGVSVDGMVATKVATPHRTQQHVNARQPQPTKTLMRRGLKTPSLSAAAAPKPALHGATSLQPKSVAAPAVVTKLSSDVIDPRRARVAGSTGRHQAVRRFKPAAPAANKPVQWGSALAPAAAQIRPTSVHAAPAVQPPAGRQTSQFAAPTRRPATQMAAPAASLPAVSTNQDDEYEQDLFSQAIAHATSHQEPAPEGIKLPGRAKKRAQVFGIVASLAVFLLLIGFVAFQKQDDIKLQLASAKAGFSASAPLYKPDGYNLSDMKYASGSVASLYQRSQNQNFTITQKKSNWDSQTLLENFVATSNQDYQGFQANGRTVYVYGGNNATWVNGGIWYQIKATSGLSSEQLVRIAASM